MFANITYKNPINLVLATNVIAYMMMFLYKKPYDYRILLAGLAVMLLLSLVYVLILKYNMGEEYLFLIVSTLVSLGMITIYRLNTKMGYQQIIWFIIGIGLYLGSYYIVYKVKVWHRLFYYYVLAAGLIYTFTLIFGKNINGSTNWIVVAGHSFQPSELTKVLYLFSLACCLVDGNGFVSKLSYKNFFKSETAKSIAIMLIAGVNMMFLFLQREWGTAVLLFLVYIVMLYVYGQSLKFFLLNVAALIPISIVGYNFLNHIKVRVDIWMNPWADAAGKGYQVVQSLIAIGSGGFFGTGIGLGKPDIVPAVYTDFIFSAICEEMGIFTGIAIIFLYFIFCYRGMKIVLNVRDNFKKILALGITVMFGFQTFIIIGGVTKLIPLTGITLPFVSYGGSSLVSSYILLGILQAISKTSSDDAGEDIAYEGE